MEPAAQSLLIAEVHWLLNSPVLLSPSAHSSVISHPFQNLPSERQSQCMRYLENMTYPLQALFQRYILQRRSTRLGIRYETLWQALFQLLPDYRILAANLQVRDQHRTWGEYDLLYTCPTTSRFYHRELAIKFYLGRPGSTGNWFDWRGPDQADQLGRKLQLMFDRQIHLSTTEPGQAALQTLPGISSQSQWQREVLLQGYLFYPWQQPCEPPVDSHPDHLRGDWLTIQQLPAYVRSAATQEFTIPARRHWLALQALEPEHNPTSPWLTPRILIHTLNKPNALRQPVLVKPAGGDNRPFFVTPNHWPTSSH